MQLSSKPFQLQISQCGFECRVNLRPFHGHIVEVQKSKNPNPERRLHEEGNLAAKNLALAQDK